MVDLARQLEENNLVVNQSVQDAYGKVLFSHLTPRAKVQQKQSNPCLGPPAHEKVIFYLPCLSVELYL